MNAAFRVVRRYASSGGARLSNLWREEIIYSAAFRVVNQARKFAVVAGLSLLAFYPLWIVFAGTFAVHELSIGIIATLLAAAGMIVVSYQYPSRFSPTMKDLLSLWRLPWYVLSRTWEVFLVAAQDLLGSKRAESVFRVVRFDARTKENPHATARRTLAAVYTTVAPNFIVLGINPSDQKLLFHQIRRSGVSKMTQELGAGA